MKRAAFGSLLIQATWAALDNGDIKFMSYISMFGKGYESLEEYVLRKGCFLTTDAEIERLNTSQTSSVHAHNMLSDLTDQEYEKMLSLKNMPAPDMPKPTVDVPN